MLSQVRLFATPWTVVSQAPLSMGFPRQEYWSDLPFSSPGDLPNPGTEPSTPSLLQETGEFCIPEPSWKPNGSSGKESACQEGASGDEGLFPGQGQLVVVNLGARLPAFES